MHVDYLNVTVPETVAASVVDGVTEVIDYCGAVRLSDEIYRLGSKGTVKIKNRHGYTLVGLSGDALQVLRDHDQKEALLWVFAGHPHRVTSMDIAHDVRIGARTVLNSLWRKARGKKGIHLSKKRVQPHNVRRHMVHCLYGEGSTGTIYMGRRTSEVRCKVYDKRNEILDRSGVDIGYDLVRYEATITSKMGLSLKDVQSPDAVFWNYMSNVLTPPLGAPNWVAGGQGFHMPERSKMMPAEKLKHIVGESPEIDRWLKYADEAGPNGRDYLLGLIRKRIMTPDKQTESSPGEEGVTSDS